MSEVLTADPGELGRDLEGFRLQDERQVRLWAQAIRVGGRMPPLQVARIDARLVVVDGFKRLRAAREAGLERVPISVVDPAGRAEALVLLAQLNGEASGLSALEEGWVVAELHRRHGQSHEQIAAVFGRDRTWALRREQLVVRLSPQVQQLIREGGLDPAAAVELVHVRHRTQIELARRASQGRLSVAQVRALVRLVLRAPDESHRRYLLDHPREVLALAGGRALTRDRFSELEVLLEILLAAAVVPDPATADRLTGLLRKLLAFLENSPHVLVADPGTPGPHSRAERQGEPLHARDRQEAQARP